MKALSWMVLAGACALAGCANDAAQKSDTAKTRAALSADGSRLVPFGDKGLELGFAKAIPERAAFGAPAVARLASGDVLVLDALKSRVVRVAQDGTLTEIAKVDHDADDLAVADDGAFAVKRSTTPKVVVYGPQGARLGELSYAILQNVERIALGPSRRVTAISAHQERYELGSPAFPSAEPEVLHSKREGIVSRADGAGLSVIREKDGGLFVVSTRAGAADERSTEVARVKIGEGDSARIVGATGNVACLRVEHLAATDVVDVRREAVCADATTGAVVFRTELGAPGAYVPHRELAFDRGVLTFAKPEADGKGLRIATFAVVGEKK